MSAPASENRETAALLLLLRQGSREVTARALEDAGGALKLLHGGNGQGDLLLDTALDAYAEELQQLREAGVALVSVLDERYPRNLRLAADRPAALFVQGTIDSRLDRSVAVIGSRAPTDPGLRLARALAERAVAAGFAVVSGLARGVDTAAHEATLESGGHTAAIIGTGIDRTYPPENYKLQRRIAHDGTLLSRFSPGTPASRKSFPLRNSVISGVSQATIVVEAGPRSGARLQSRLALAQGRRIFLHRRLLAEDWARTLAEAPGVVTFRDAGDLDFESEVPPLAPPVSSRTGDHGG